MTITYQRPDAFTDAHTHYCPGCTHGVAHRLLAEALDELNLREKTILVAPVGCAVFIADYFELDGCIAAHGRAPAMATGIKRVQPDKVVVTYQGDGDLASIGAAEVMHAAVRGENITIVFINNAIYGMTGGQMAPTSIIGQKTTSSPQGRSVVQSGHPIQMSELLAGLAGSAYVVRRSLHDAANIRKAKKAILTALKVQQAGLGFSLVELLSTCPTNWGLSPMDSLAWVKTHMLPIYPVGDFKVADGVKEVMRDGVRSNS
ncbi:MAG: 2-oxoglutarate oxidoreductase [Anaerolineaceae bacterium]|nr:MAG: 2-oxoglutarate oxidoreductase [Anaerolineaceae bacterium]